MDVKLLPGNEPRSDSELHPRDEMSQSESIESVKRDRMVGKTDFRRFSLTSIKSVMRVER